MSLQTTNSTQAPMAPCIKGQIDGDPAWCEPPTQSPTVGWCNGLVTEAVQANLVGQYCCCGSAISFAVPGQPRCGVKNVLFRPASGLHCGPTAFSLASPTNSSRNSTTGSSSSTAAASISPLRDATSRPANVVASPTSVSSSSGTQKSSNSVIGRPRVAPIVLLALLFTNLACAL